MLFNSIEFIVFILLFFSAWPFLRKKKNTRWVYLTISSFVFYGWWDWRFLFLILFSGFIDYFSGLAMERWPIRKKTFLIISVLTNVGSLGVFKYLDFFITNVNWTLDILGLNLSIPFNHLILPVGISFYTFQSMSYTIDIYRGKLQPTKNVFHFFAYLAMFPQLVAGPIVRAADLLPQLEEVCPTSEKQRWEGMTLIVYGFFKKVVVADTLAPIVDHAFFMDSPLGSSSYWWLIMLMFSFQIYCDFSGYSDIARGLAKWMGYEFPLNFDHPYISRSIREFWSRWHISLSTWFRDYVYIPLGGSKGNFYSGSRNMVIAMLISGLWHGAAWTFIVWGGLHATYLFIERLTNWPQKLSFRSGGKHASVVIVFIMVLVSWVFFRAESFSQAGIIFLRLFDIRNFNFELAISIIESKKAILLIILVALRQVYVYFDFHHAEWNNHKLAYILRPVIIGILLTACVFFRGTATAFIYFQF